MTTEEEGTQHNTGGGSWEDRTLTGQEQRQLASPARPCPDPTLPPSPGSGGCGAGPPRERKEKTPMMAGAPSHSEEEEAHRVDVMR